MRDWQKLLCLLAWGVFLLFFISPLAFSQAPDGIPRDLARQRTQQIKDVRYELAYNLRPKADSIVGHEELRFVQNADDRGILPEWLDFREGSLSILTINGHVAPPIIQNGHIELPARFLQQGENVVEIDFIAPVAPAGKAITRFEDKDDGSEYLYTLFVPMDADMAFPCFDQPDLKGKFKLTITAPLDWNVISNSVGQEVMKQGNDAFAIHRIEFAETKPISTYLFAFAAGPFKKVHDTPGLPGLYVRKSKFEKAEAEGGIRSAGNRGRDQISFGLLCPAVSLPKVRPGHDSRLCLWRHGACRSNVPAGRVDSLPHRAHAQRPPEPRHSSAARTHPPVVWRSGDHALV